MVDHPDEAPLWGLSATRVAYKPFTVTEYQHPAPNDWAAECVPLIACYAAQQDWDGVFLFAYSHDTNYRKQKIASFFDIEGNPTKMPLMPMGARLFLGAGPQPGPVDYYSVPEGTFPKEYAVIHPLQVRSEPAPPGTVISKPWVWSTTGPGTGRFIDAVRGSVVFVGFTDLNNPIDLGSSGVRLETMSTPFATLIIQSTQPTKPFDQSDELLITAVARARNTDVQWDRPRQSVGTHWGKEPVQIEVVTGTISLPGKWSHAFALDTSGKATDVDVASLAGDRTLLRLGTSTALAYRVVR